MSNASSSFLLNLQAAGSQEPVVVMAQIPGNEDKDDSVSVTSTIDEYVDSEEEFHLIKILAERLVGEVTMYLVEWEGFPLSNATWEPLEHLQEGTISGWEKFKRETGRRTASGFQVGHWKTALRRDVEKKRARHDHRNQKRVSSGLQETEFESLLQEYLETTEGALEDYEESGHDDGSSQLPKDDDERNAQDNGDASKAGPSDAMILKADAVAAVQSRKHGSAKDLPRDVEPPRRKVDEKSQPESTDLRLPKSSGKVPGSAKEMLSDKSGRSKSSAERPTGTLAAATSTSKNLLHGPARTMIAASSRQMSTRTKVTGRGANVFIGGKVRKERPSLLDAVVDPSKEPRLLNARHQNLVQKRLRDREGVVAPIHPPAELMSLDGSEAGFVRRNSATDSLRGTAAATYEAPDDHNVSETEGVASPPGEPSSGDDRSTLQGIDPDNISSPQAGKRAKKRNRSVHWDADVTMKGTTDESSLFVRQSPPAQMMTDDRSGRTAGVAVAFDCAPKSSSPSSGGCGQATTQSVSKTCQFGSGTQLMTLIFTGFPANNDSPCLVAFINQSVAVFAHSCTAKDFMTQILYLREEQLCRGHISEETDGGAIASMANRLDLGGFGLVCLSQDYCVLIFPSHCKDWDDENIGANADSAGSLLNYSIFKPKPSFASSMLAPLSYEMTSTGDGAATTPELPVFDLFFEHKYDQLLPPNARGSPRHKFFLAFPPSAREEACLVSQWLRVSNSDCDIWTSLQAGDWSSFVKVDSGTFILHEDAIWATRMFPRFAEILHASSQNFSFYLFRRSLLFTNPLSSLELSMPGIGGKELCRIFRPGTAILVTPSFLVSQPAQAYNFFKWFFQNFSRSSQEYRRGKLVLCAGIEDWLFDLALEKSKEYEEQARTNLNQKTAAALKHGIEQRFKTLSLVRQLIQESADEVENPLVFAPDVIDGNDEQSLVHWFGWWTIMNMAQLRKFFVLGSSAQSSERLTRLVQVQDYQVSAAEEREATPDDQEGSHGSGERHGAALQLAFSDEGGAIRDSLARVETSMLKEEKRPLRLYRFPVSYWDRDMPFYFNDIKSAFEPYGRWFSFFADHMRRFLGPDGLLAPGGVNTYAGLFYTIEGGWDRTQYPKGLKPTRRPWIALYRPVNPHKKPWRTAELFICDYATRGKYPGDAEVYISNLIDAQRELIKLVKKQSEGILLLPLERVWLGDISTQGALGGYSHPLDITLDWLGNLLPNIRDWLPAPDMHVPRRGWKLINPAQAPPKAAVHESEEAMDLDTMDVNGQEGNVTGKEKAVFHPPLMEGQKTHARFSNNLYHWAEMERSRGVRGQAEFTFRPTLAWYEQLLQHGRGFHHINVMSWDSLFARYNIDDPKGI